ncbi:hypothetical protein FD17_GL001217 [Lentilactobacillus sunkii DSM 19904]|uniref:N-acetyltransferase domain-containing protein n=2 Tax=Lentilactobacillus sunkii TaxID=481719 RepID=A0A0R1L253_9LACO|nr:hypothetical protein FD17_GL001217 [Lentilactobacillus sunkii DSM 19904]
MFIMPQIKPNKNNFESFFTKGTGFMLSFEKFHPVLTAHLTLDWLTQTPVKSIDDLFSKPSITTAKAEKMPSEILDTVKNINHIMRLVMNGKELTWGMTDSNSQAFVGIVSLRGFEEAGNTGSIEFIIDQSHRGYLAEAVQRTVQFAKDHFDFKQITVTFSDASDQTRSALTGIGFEESSKNQFTVNI